MRKRKPQIRSEKCALVTLGVSFNIRDPEQEKDLEFADSLVNFSGDVKRWIRDMRLGRYGNQYHSVTQLNDEVKSFTITDDIPELSDDDALESLI